MRRPRIVLFALIGAVALGGCGEAAIRDNTDDEPTPAVEKLLAAAPETACSKQSPRAEQVEFVTAHPELTNDQLAKLCPDLYPKDYLDDEDK